MIKGTLITLALLFVIVFVFSQSTEPLVPTPAQDAENPNLSNKHIDFAGFLSLGDSLSELRNSCMISEETFLQYSQEEHTIILDTRSKEAFDDIHVKGAIHLNFSDFTEQKLQAKIPSKDTRILIYCNNNFESNRASLFNKRVDLALNIPTFINLHGYGYTNVYELGEYVSEEETVIPLESNKLVNLPE